MMDQEQTGTYRALPLIENDIREFILNKEGGPVSELGESLGDLGSALSRVDDELAGVVEANPNLAAILNATVEGTYLAFAKLLESEQAKAYVRAIAYINAFVVLRALDMQWRRVQSS